MEEEPGFEWIEYLAVHLSLTSYCQSRHNSFAPRLGSFNPIQRRARVSSFIAARQGKQKIGSIVLNSFIRRSITLSSALYTPSFPDPASSTRHWSQAPIGQPGYRTLPSNASITTFSAPSTRRVLRFPNHSMFLSEMNLRPRWCVNQYEALKNRSAYWL